MADVGFALLFPAAHLDLPSLLGAASDRTEPPRAMEWGPDAERVWGWKDELPRRVLAWYGRFLNGRQSFLSPDLLADLYPRAGRPEDFAEAPLGPDARRIARMLLRSGPLSTAALREALDAEGGKAGARFASAQRELGRALVITHHGVEEQPTGWPSAVLELTARAFAPVLEQRRDPAERRRRAASRYLETVLWARPYHLGNAFGWGAPASRSVLEELVESGSAVRVGPGYAWTDREPGDRDGIRRLV